MPAISDIIDADFGSRVVALRAVGTALGLSGAQLPSPNTANSGRTYLRWINSYRASLSLPLLPGLDFGGFNSALNALLVAAGDIAAPINVTAPYLDSSGGTAAGNVLSCTMGTWDNIPSSYAYQWKRGGVNIAGATTNAHTVVAADSGTTVTCAVTATNVGGSASSTSNGVAIP